MTTRNEEPSRAPSTSRSIFAFRRNLVLAASAGTGKTHALVGVAVHLLVGACEAEGGGLRAPILPDALVATTFSRKAAAEIRERLSTELSKLAAGDPSSAYREEILAASALAGARGFSETELMDRASVAEGQLGRARIGTLHRFAASLVRAHALLMGLSPDFDLLDEVTTVERAKAAIERVLETRAGDKDVRALVELTRGVVPFVDLAQKLLAQIADDGRGASSLTIAENDAAEVEDAFQILLGHARALGQEPKLGAPAARLLAVHARGDMAQLEDAVADLCAVPGTGRRSPTEEAFFAYRGTLPGESIAERGRRLVRRWQVRDQMTPRARAMKSLLVACEAEIREENLKDSVLGFADVLRAARDLLRDHLPVALEASAGLEALLVDEVQDTSGVQRDLVHLLWERHSDGAQVRLPGTIPRAGELRPTGLLVVGDRKQSIYAFRGADAAVFAELCVGLAGAKAREALAIPRGVVWEPTRPTADFVSLRHNRRGEPELLQFANEWSRLTLVPEGHPPRLYEVDYVPTTEDLLPPARSGGDVAVARTTWLRPQVASGQRSTKLRDAEIMAARIGCIVRGEELTARGSPARWRDVAILALDHDTLAAASYALAKADIPHVVAGMGFHGAREVRDVVAMLACLVDPDDTLALVEVLRGPWAGASDRSLVALTDRHEGLAPVARWGVGERRHLMSPEERPAIEALARLILEMGPLTGRIGPGAALREAVRRLMLEETLVLLPRGEQRVANVRKVLSMADAASDPIALLHRLRTAAVEEEREGEAATFSDEDDAVRLLTVHACKGLAFPIVFLPGAGAAKRTGPLAPVVVQTGVAGKASALVMRLVDDAGAVHDSPSYAVVKVDLRRREAAEQQRIRYVAVTRASLAMFFVGDRVLPRGSSVAYDRSTAGVLARLAVNEDSRALAQLTVETGSSLDRSAPREAPLFMESRPEAE